MLKAWVDCNEWGLYWVEGFNGYGDWLRWCGGIGSARWSCGSCIGDWKLLLNRYQYMATIWPSLP